MGFGIAGIFVVVATAVWLAAFPALYIGLGLGLRWAPRQAGAPTSCQGGVARAAFAIAWALSLVGPAPWLALALDTAPEAQAMGAQKVVALALAHVGIMLAFFGREARMLVRDCTDEVLHSLLLAGGGATPASAAPEAQAALSEIPSWLSSGRGADLPMPAMRSGPLPPRERSYSAALGPATAQQDPCVSSVTGLGPYFVVMLLSLATGVAALLPAILPDAQNGATSTTTGEPEDSSSPVLGSVACISGAVVFVLGLVPLFSSGHLVTSIARQLAARSRKQLASVRQRRDATLGIMVARVEDHAVGAANACDGAGGLEDFTWRANRAKAGARAALASGDGSPAKFLGTLTRAEVMALGQFVQSARGPKRIRRRSDTTSGAFAPHGYRNERVGSGDYAAAAASTSAPSRASTFGVDARRSRHSSFSVLMSPGPSPISAEGALGGLVRSLAGAAPKNRREDHLIWQLRGREGRHARAVARHRWLSRVIDDARRRMKQCSARATVAACAALALAHFLSIPLIAASGSAELLARCSGMANWSLGTLGALVLVAGMLAHSRLGTTALARRVCASACGFVRAGRVAPALAFRAQPVSGATAPSMWSIAAVPTAAAVSSEDSFSVFGSDNAAIVEAPIPFV